MTPSLAELRMVTTDRLAGFHFGSTDMVWVSSTGSFGRGDGRLSVKSVDGGPEYVVVDVCGIGASAFGELRSGDVVFDNP